MLGGRSRGCGYTPRTAAIASRVLESNNWHGIGRMARGGVPRYPQKKSWRMPALAPTPAYSYTIKRLPRSEEGGWGAVTPSARYNSFCTLISGLIVPMADTNGRCLRSPLDVLGDDGASQVRRASSSAMLALRGPVMVLALQSCI
eukprot:CAMPEP_0194395246 /NCGR_PEP_ID=MMETSP0174-20130528/124315_1 /TAXON_ID=216777 /ORGANISM="Proboscia alata, Strain PI-D3" /LENGTH=144 /DNA_ID=CAMNT_0039191159 /DNA_START=1296 /DNA_END=1730 /DNA_ORIENTATION=+